MITIPISIIELIYPSPYQYMVSTVTIFTTERSLIEFMVDDQLFRRKS
jgi:hypothetical protein